MARLDRRYLAPLLAMVNAIVESAGGGLRAQPAAASLFESRDYGQADSLRDGSAPAPSIVDELFDIVLSGIEDAADTVPRFALPPAEWLDAGLLDVVPGAAKAARRAEPARPPWPRVSSEERGAGWFVSCSAEHRRQIHLFVRLALATPPGEPPAAQAVCWRQELADAAAQVLGAFLVPAGLDSPNARIGDPFGAARVAADTDDPAAYLRALQARHPAAAALPSVLGAYYWAVRPVVALLADVAPLEARRAGSGSAAGGELAEIMRWAESVCAGLASGPAALLGEALFDDVCHIIAAPGAGQLAESTAVSPGPALVAAQDSAVTPLELESSAASSPDPACDIAVSELRAACAGANGALEPAAATPGQLAQAAVLRHWARTCEAELAAMLVACGATAAQGGAGLAQSEAVRGLARRAQLLVLAQPSGGQQGQSPLLDKLSLALAAGKRHRALQQPLAGRLAEQRAKLAAADRESGSLRRSLQQALESHAAQRDQAAEQAQALQRAEAGAARWEAECERERARLAQSEAAGAEAREQLVRLADRHEALQAAVDAKQAAWDCRQLSLTESIRGLEVALAEAMARVRELDAQAAADHAAAELLRAQVDQMRATLADYAKVSDALHDLSRRPH
ncbi:hypothetical protein H4R21_000330 [Coemansia helicoidea]|uniref:Uncharacterized protein n=1 Tax=Coemansia helicoidea TaxID=1286919 RepID=A0ACC1LGW3_9FUNG|nr:hypothetical protein H4R21_000330 [Coemansia helicoidea]